MSEKEAKELIDTISKSEFPYAIAIAKAYEKLQQENQQLKMQISAREEKYRQLENNWNELWDYIMQELLCYGNDSIEYEVSKDIITKMKELERSKQDEL